MKKRKYLLLTIGVLLISLLAACTTKGETASLPLVEEAMGNLILRVNPEIKVEYDREGRVTSIVGLNDDGVTVVAEYDNYIGKNAKKVVNELVSRIHQSGYFVTDVDGEYRNVTIQIEPGSVLPNEKFLEFIAEDVQKTVNGFNMNSSVLNIGDSDYDDRYDTPNAPSKYISKEKAMEIALVQAGANIENVVFDDRDFDFNNGRPVYEFEFYVGNIEYEIEIDALTGKVLKYEVDEDGDSDYHIEGVSAPTKKYIDGVSKPTQKKHNSNYGNSPYGDSDYGVVVPAPTPAPVQKDTDYGVSDYSQSDYSDSGYSNYDSGYSDYDDGDSDYN